MIKTTEMFLEELRDYANPKAKLSRMVKRGECFRIAKELYETDGQTPGHLLAGSIYGPSYLSFAYALQYYEAIPEAVYVFTCATFEKKKKKKYDTPFGTFIYQDVPSAAFPQELRLVREGDYFYRIAGPEKALCDQLYIMPPVASARGMAELLTADLRMEEGQLRKLDIEVISGLAEHYHSTNVRRLAALLRRMKR